MSETSFVQRTSSEGGHNLPSRNHDATLNPISLCFGADGGPVGDMNTTDAWALSQRIWY